MQLEIQRIGVVSQIRREEPAVLVFPISREPQKLFRDDKTITAFNSHETYEKSSSAIVSCADRYCLFYSGSGVGLSLPWTVLPILLRRPLLPIPLPGALLPVSVSRTLLPAPGLGCRRQWASRILSLLVSGLLRATRSPFCEIARVTRAERPGHFQLEAIGVPQLGLT